MSRLELIFQFVFSNLFEITILLTTVSAFILRGYQLISENYLINILIFGFSALLIGRLISSYLNFMLTVRQNRFFDDNRSIHFLNFDAMKFFLIGLALCGLIYLGINKVLNNETIATLLGGLIGSLLTMKGSYNDLKFTKEEKDNLNSVSQTSPTVHPKK